MRQVFVLLVLTGGLFLTARAQFINNNAAIVTTGGSHLVLNNLSFQNNGTFSQAAGTVLFSGNAGTFIGGNTLPQFYNVALNKPGAVLQLQTGIQVNHQLQFTDGLLDMAGQVINLNTDAVLTGEHPASRLTGTTGYVQLVTTLNAPASANPGNLGVILSSTENLGTVTVRRGHQSQTNSFGGGNSILRYYSVQPASNTSLNATVRLNYFDNELNGLDENGLVLWSATGAQPWTNLGFTGRDVTANYVEQAGINSLSLFTLSSPNNNLPLVWNSFHAQCLSGSMRISWITLQEQNTAFFTIRRSADGRNWSTIGTIPAAGNSTTPLDYSFTDPQPLPGNGYYQVLEQDLDGRQSLSPVLANSCMPASTLKVYPNPVVSFCRIAVQSQSASLLQIKLLDNKGALLQQKQVAVQPGNNAFTLSMEGMAKGIYSMLITWPDGKAKVVRLEKQ